MKRIIHIVFLTSALALIVGCGGNDNASSSEISTDHAAEAQQSITGENMDSHLADLEAEIAADEASLEN